MAPKLFLCLLLLVTTSCNLPPKMPKGKNIQICIELDSTISAHEQWVYLHHYEGNEHVIHDSAYIKKGQKEIYLHAYAPEEDTFSVLFSEKGPIDWFLILAPNSYIKTSVSANDGISPAKKIDGSYAYNEYVQKSQNSVALNQKKRNLMAELATPRLADDDSRKINEQIARIDQQLDSIQMHIVQHSASALNTHSVLAYHLKGKVSRDSLITLCNIALKRFPHNKKIESIIRPVRKEVLPESEESQIIDKKIGDIIARRMQSEFKVSQPESTVESINIDSISLISDKGEKIAIAQLKKKYILIDFWASWCMPCRDAMPYVLQAQKKYADALTICLVSMDKNHTSWKKAIEMDKLEGCINLVAIDEKGNMDKNINKMNIKTIPYNILLDEQHNIIATNLHQKELLEKLDELIN